MVAIEIDVRDITDVRAITVIYQKLLHFIIHCPDATSLNHYKSVGTDFILNVVTPFNE